MKKIFTLALGLWLVACSKEDKAVAPTENSTCVLQENTTGQSTFKFTHDAQGKLLKREILENGVLNRYNVYEYNSQQLIKTEFFYRADGTLEGQYTYAYGSDGLLIQMNSRLLVNGTMQETFYCTYDYAAANQVARRTMWHPDGRMMSYFLYEYENGQMRRVLTHNASGMLTQTLTLQYDDKLPVLKDMLALRKINWLMVGYPHEHNITSYQNTSGNGQVLNDSYTAVYEFNSSGRPSKSTRHHPDGRQVVTVFSYQCK